MIFGIDTSNYQAGINLAKARAEGMDFLIAKVTQGSGYRSPAWPAQRDGARAAGLLLAGYHYIDTSDPAAQAANCAGHLGDKSIPLALDWESAGGNWLNFVRVLAAFRAAGLKVVLAYSPHWYWQQQGSPDMASIGLPLWASGYPSPATGQTPAALYGSVTARHWASYGGLNVAVLQFSDRAAVAGLSLDCSAFNGTRAQLETLFGAPAPAPPTPAPKPTPTPTPAPHLSGDDHVADIPITLKPDGSFRRLITEAEAGKSSAIFSGGWVKFGAAWGTATFRVCQLRGGAVMPGGDKSFSPRLNEITSVPLLDGVEAVTLEGTASLGSDVSAAVIHTPR